MQTEQEAFSLLPPSLSPNTEQTNQIAWTSAFTPLVSEKNENLLQLQILMTNSWKPNNCLWGLKTWKLDWSLVNFSPDQFYILFPRDIPFTH